MPTAIAANTAAARPLPPSRIPNAMPCDAAPPQSRVALIKAAQKRNEVDIPQNA